VALRMSLRFIRFPRLLFDERYHAHPKTASVDSQFGVDPPIPRH
jgi:hypothetical protein